MKIFRNARLFGLLTTCATSGWRRRNLSMTASILNSGRKSMRGHLEATIQFLDNIIPYCESKSCWPLTKSLFYAYSFPNHFSDTIPCHPGIGNEQECTIRQKEAETSDPRPLLQGVGLWIEFQKMICQIFLVFFPFLFFDFFSPDKIVKIRQGLLALFGKSKKTSDFAGFTKLQPVMQQQI